MGRRSRKHRQPRVRGEAANELVREELEPLAPGEIPLAIKVGAAIAAIIALFNPIAFAAGYEIAGPKATWLGTAIPSALMATVAIFMWRMKYWAVLGFQAVMAITILQAMLALTRAGNLYAVVLCLGLTAGAGTMFWFLIRVMARIQMPERPSKVTRHG